MQMHKNYVCNIAQIRKSVKRIVTISLLCVRRTVCVWSAESLQAGNTEGHVEPSAGLLYGDQRRHE